VLKALQVAKMPLAESPPRDSRCASPLSYALSTPAVCWYSAEGRTDQLVFFTFDLLYLNGEARINCKERLQRPVQEGNLRAAQR
jgi:hypothetical protein